MFYEAELRQLRDTFRKCRIATSITELEDAPNYQHYKAKLPLFADIDPIDLLLHSIQSILPATIYRLCDSFRCQYLFLRLPELPSNAVLIIGPFLSAPLENRQIMEWLESKGISPASQKKLENFYNSLPILPDASHLFMLLDTFAERLWGANNFSSEDVDQDLLLPISSLKENSSSSEEENTLLHMKNLEQRYAYENELISAVSKGQLHKADILLANFSTFFFEQRVADPVRNAKNYCIIMNTLLRKAAEQGKVHPMYLDSTSSNFAIKIEQLHSLDATSVLLTEMFRTYCRLVRKHTMKNYSPPVQKALIYIDANLSENLNLRSLSEILNVSSSYLSTLFKKETGKTLTEHINRCKIKHAKHLLESTRLQIQTIAQHCGIEDVQYFSRVFKRITGMTPKEYRDSLKG